ncbi:MAG: SpoIIE family protein phosphatase [Acidobacteriota bacterium]
MESNRPQVDAWLLAVVALAGTVVSCIAMSRWAPDAAVAFPSREAAVSRAFEDAEALGYRVAGKPRLQLSAGSRAVTSLADLQVLVENQPNVELRRRLLQAAPPIRLGVRFYDAVGGEGVPDTLLLEYDGRATLAGAAFAADRFLSRGPRPFAQAPGPEFADRAAELLLGKPPPAPIEARVLETVERVYSPGGAEPAAYVSLSANTRWLAHRQPIGEALLTYSVRRFISPGEQIRFYSLIAIGLLALAVLLWRLAKRRAGFGQAPAFAALLIVGLLPSVAFLTEPTSVVLIWLYFLLSLLGVLLAWTVAEAELREVRGAATEHYDRLLARRPLRATGGEMLAGFAIGCGLSGLRGAGGELAAQFGGGYSNVLTILPDQWALGSPLSQGLILAAATCLLVSFGGRLAGRLGGIAGATFAAAPWSLVMSVAPLTWALGLGLIASLAAGWVLWHRGLLALAVASVTALSLPTAWIGWLAFPLQPAIPLVASLPLLVPLAGGLLLWKAPRRGGDEEIAPAWVSALRRSVRLNAEIELLRSMQLSLLPAESLHQAGRAEIAWRMIPADTVGGDFLEVTEDADGRLWVAVADVAGHGIACSTLTAYTKAAVVEHAVAGATPATALPKIRHLFARLRPARSQGRRRDRTDQPRSRTMVTLLLALWDPRRREITVAAAGHPPLLLFDGTEVHELGQPRQPLGVDLGGEDVEQTLTCEGRAVWVAFSDGVVEATSPDGESFGYRRWPERLPHLAEHSAEETLAALLDQVDRHRRGQTANDDVTAVVVTLPAK